MDLGAQSSSFKGQTGIIYIQNQRHLATRINSFGSVSFHTKFHSWLPTPERLKWSEYCASFPPVGRVNHELLAPGAVTSCLISPTLLIFTIWTARRACSGGRTACPERLCTLCPQGFSRQHQIQPRGTRWDLPADCSEQALERDDLQRSLPTWLTPRPYRLNPQ